jgi:hypothetical protein
MENTPLAIMSAKMMKTSKAMGDIFRIAAIEAQSWISSTQGASLYALTIHNVGVIIIKEQGQN